MRIIGTIEARMGSSRLPGKTLSEIYSGKHLLECVVSRFRLADSIADVVVATTTEPGDDPIVEWCNVNGTSFFRGSEDDVLGRVAGAAEHFGADAIVQMGADSAYLDYLLVDQLVERYLHGDFDYVCNDMKLTYPLGIYAHVVNVKKLVELTKKTGLSKEDISDVVRYIWEHPKSYVISNLEAPQEFHYPELRLTIDYPEDLEQAKKVYSHFGGYRFTTMQIIELYREKPEYFAKTMDLKQKSAPSLDATP